MYYACGCVNQILLVRLKAAAAAVIFSALCFNLMAKYCVCTTIFRVINVCAVPFTHFHLFLAGCSCVAAAA